jgi:hypothetical protein
MTSPRTRTAARLAVVSTAVVLGAASLGCGIIQNVVDTANTLGEFGDRLGKASEMTYTAEYTVADGSNVIRAQQPPNAAFIAGKERVIFAADSLIMCSNNKECQRAPMPGGAAIRAEDAGLIAGVTGPGFMTPELALGLIAATALIPGTDVDTSEKEYAGEDSLCASVTGVAEGMAQLEDGDTAADTAKDTGDDAVANSAESLDSFTVCVTEAGVLAAFSGTTVDGKTSAMELVKFQTSADPRAFAPPKGAKVVDVTQIPAQ